MKQLVFSLNEWEQLKTLQSTYPVPLGRSGSTPDHRRVNCDPAHKRVVWRIIGSKVIDVNVRNMWLSHVLRDSAIADFLHDRLAPGLTEV